MNEKWLTEIVSKDGNILCPFCGKPFLKWDFQIIRKDDCQHDIKSLLTAYYFLLNTLAQMSLLEGSNYNLSRKAHETLIYLEEMMNIKGNF